MATDVTTTTEWDQINGTSQSNHGPLLARAMSTRPFSSKEPQERCKTLQVAMNAVRNKNGHHCHHDHTVIRQPLLQPLLQPSFLVSYYDAAYMLVIRYATNSRLALNQTVALN